MKNRFFDWLHRPRGFRIVSKVAEIWGQHSVARHSASLAFFSLLTTAPMLVVLTGIAGYFLGVERVSEQILKAVGRAIGEGAQQFVQQLLEQTLQKGSSATATLVGLVLSLWGASGLLQSMKGSLDEFWRSPPMVQSGVLQWFLARLIASVGVLILVIIISASLILELVLTAVRQQLPDHLPFRYWLGYVLNRALFPIVLCFGIALLYWWLPYPRLRWRVAMWSALVATLLLMVMRTLVSLYLSTTGIATLYGSAGSVVVLLLWVYFSAQVFFLGAIFSIALWDGVSLNADAG